MSTFKETFATDSAADRTQLAETNKTAWDRLYASTGDALVWGDTPLPFVAEAITFLRSRNQLPEQPAMLDAATGEGRNLPTLLEATQDVTACDASRAALAKLSSRFGHQVNAVECDLAAMPFESFSFDMILACDIIETLPNLEEVLLEMKRVLRPTGILVANVPDFDDGISGTDMQPLETGDFMYKGDYFFRFQDENAFLATMHRAGFRLISCQPTTWWEPPHPGYRDEVHSHTSRIVIAARMMD